MKCSQCGADVDNNAAFCPKCGSPMAAEEKNNEIKCPKCGEPVDSNDAFCQKCGSPIHTTEKVQGEKCPRCGHPIDENDVFCANCGAPVKRREINIPAIDKPQTKGKTIKQNQILIVIAIVVILVVCLSAAAIITYFIMTKDDMDASMPPAPSIATNKVQQSTPTAPPAAPVNAVNTAPVMTVVNASSTRSTDSEGGKYSKESVLSEDPMTKWVPSKEYKNGIGQWIEISAGTPQHVQGLKILNGYHKNANTWQYNNRVQNCTVTFSDGTSRSFVLNDTMDMITLDLGAAIDTTSVRLTIDSVYRGTKWDDTAITYLGVY